MFDHTLLDKCRKKYSALDAFPEVRSKRIRHSVAVLCMRRTMTTLLTSVCHDMIWQVYDKVRSEAGVVDLREEEAERQTVRGVNKRK